MQTMIIKKDNGQDIARYINESAKQHKKVFIGSEELFTRWGTPAHVHKNGTVSVSMVARSRKSASRTDYYKIGDLITIRTA